MTHSYTVSAQRVQIERVIRRGPDRRGMEWARASFTLVGGFRCCSADICLDTRAVCVWPTSGPMTPDQAGALAISIQMALDWIAQELATGKPAALPASTERAEGDGPTTEEKA